MFNPFPATHVATVQLITCDGVGCKMEIHENGEVKIRAAGEDGLLVAATNVQTIPELIKFINQHQDD